MIANYAKSLFFRYLGQIEKGRLTLTTPDGKTHGFEGQAAGTSAHIDIYEWRVIGNLIRKGDIGFAEDYRAGLWASPDLPALLTFAMENHSALKRFINGNRLFSLLSMLSYATRANSLKGSKKNIYAHYDLGNEFYELWLDKSMTYSAAIYEKPDQDLHAAQLNKYDRILNCLPSQSGNLLEIGCGWGGFAARAHDKGDFGIKGITLSPAQQNFAKNRLKDKADILLEDYRHQKGKYDHIVSIEMFEAVGERYWPTYFKQIQNLLAAKGRAVVQTITIHENEFLNYRKGADFIRSYIFPGGMLPSPSRFEQAAARAGLKQKSRFDFGPDYAQTLREWLINFDHKYSAVKALGFDDGFVRLWRFYLAYCIAGFQTGHINVMQAELAHGD